MLKKIIKQYLFVFLIIGLMLTSSVSSLAKDTIDNSYELTKWFGGYKVEIKIPKSKNFNIEFDLNDHILNSWNANVTKAKKDNTNHYTLTSPGYETDNIGFIVITAFPNDITNFKLEIENDNQQNNNNQNNNNQNNNNQNDNNQNNNNQNDNKQNNNNQNNNNQNNNNQNDNNQNNNNQNNNNQNDNNQNNNNQNNNNQNNNNQNNNNQNNNNQNNNNQNNNEQDNSSSKTPSIQDIKDKYKELKPADKSNFKNIYIKNPNLNTPYDPGQLKSQYIVDGLNAVNFVRYLAGIPSDIKNNQSKEYQQQAAALVNALNNQLSHSPNRPNNIDDSLYNTALIGSRSNLCYSYNGTTYHTLYDSVKLYMSDNSPSNIEMVGHRRWILNPPMQTTTFGQVNAYSSMYTSDNTRSLNSFDYTNINWPSKGNFPVEFFNNEDPWSVSLNTAKFDNTKTNDIIVTLTRKSDKKVWKFDKSDTNKTGKYFNVNTSGFGIPYCIIFRPDDITEYKNNDEFEVVITGLYDINGNSQTIKYKTKFFDL